MSKRNWLSTNAKLSRSGIFSWGIPAYKSASGKITCPGAKDCLLGCYARNGFYVMPSVKKAQEERLALSESDAFVDTIDAEIKRRKIKVLRIHDSGDFYSRSYLNSWLEIIKRNPSVRFYAYTKMVPLFRPNPGSGLRFEAPSNFTVIFSLGGKWDNKVDTANDRHSAVFGSLKELRAAGYANTTQIDANAYGKNPKIGLVYHGPKSKEWSASA
jgi:hypothetical protein